MTRTLVIFTSFGTSQTTQPTLEKPTWTLITGSNDWHSTTLSNPVWKD